MREILFRGKTEEGVWVQGDLFHDTHWNNAEVSKITYFDEKGLYKEYGIIPETVGQYTGLIDKNGTKIFEGDIIEYKDEYGQIEYHEGEAMFVAEFDIWLSDFDHMYGNELEVIGNIHDNPELLKGGVE